MVQLHQSVLYDGTWPPYTDLPTQPATDALDVSIVSEGYLLSLNDGRTRHWKLLIEDPLTILQIRRESWDADPDGLVLSLVKNGLPFQVLNTYVSEEASVCARRGPAVRPSGKPPTYEDYLAYCQDLVDLFERCPHAYVAALCAGGILWRIAVGFRPLPTEQHVVQTFHPGACVFRSIGGNIYATPTLTELEEKAIVGVYSWTKSKRA
jgi:hypothetical protein